MNEKITGGCLCGKLTYEVPGPITSIDYCHCLRCRKASGSAFAAVTSVSKSRFKITAGLQYLKSYKTDAEFERVFCSECGSQLYSIRPALADTIRLRLGSIDTDIEGKVSAHIFAASKAVWHDICDQAPQYDQRPPMLTDRST